jgi:hypothetical protein
MNSSTINIADLIRLLDQPTLDALSARLHKVLDTLEGADAGQLLFEFIHEGLTAHEEFDPRAATMVLCEIEQDAAAA